MAGRPPVILAALEEALWAAARALLPAGAITEAAVCQGIVERSARYTTHREALATPMRGAQKDRDLAARAVFFSVADAGKLWTPLGELCGRGLLPARPTIRVLDLGAGAGAMSLGLASFLAERALPSRAEILAIDRDREALAVLARAVTELPGALASRLSLETRPGTLAGAPLPAADLVLMGSLLNELAADKARALVLSALDALSPEGALIVIEPALRDVARRLHALRDDILAAERGYVLAPCTRQAAPCPALADPKDWCHEDRPAALPPRCARLANRTGLRTGGLKFSYLVLRKRPARLVPEEPGQVALRVVSCPRRQKGSFSLFACGEVGRVELRRLSRHRGSENRIVDRALRGDVLVVGEAVINRSNQNAKTAKNPPIIDLFREDKVIRLTPSDKDFK